MTAITEVKLRRRWVFVAELAWWGGAPGNALAAALLQHARELAGRDGRTAAALWVERTRDVLFSVTADPPLRFKQTRLFVPLVVARDAVHLSPQSRKFFSRRETGRRSAGLTRDEVVVAGTLAQFLDLDWACPVRHHLYVDAENYLRAKKDAAADSVPWKGFERPPNQNHTSVSNQEMEAQIARGRTHGLFTPVTWDEPAASYLVGLRAVWLVALQSLGAPDEVRLVIAA